jgi:RimJ/RimL family protein N-acetyltransferase
VSWPGLWERLEGRIVVLEPLAPRHARPLAEAARDPEIWRWVSFPGHEPDAFARWFEVSIAAAEAGTEAPFATLDAATGEAIGSTRFLTLRRDDRGVEIGWTWLRRDRWQTGANVDAKLLMLEHAFERLGCMRVEFKTDARNERSRAALEAIPARFEGIFRKHKVLWGGRIRDSAYYSVIDDDWAEVRANLERRLVRART